jgi:hypothetical protein
MVEGFDLAHYFDFVMKRSFEFEFEFCREKLVAPSFLAIRQMDGHTVTQSSHKLRTDYYTKSWVSSCSFRRNFK